MGWIRGLLAGMWQIARAIAIVFADGWRTLPLYLLLLTVFLIVGYFAWIGTFGRY